MSSTVDLKKYSLEKIQILETDPTLNESIEQKDLGKYDLQSSNNEINVQKISSPLNQNNFLETGLLQNVNIDPSFFDRVNLDINTVQEEIVERDNSTSNKIQPMNILNNIELQILKEVQSPSTSRTNQKANRIFLASSDPMVTSTTTVISFEDSAITNDQDNLELKFYNQNKSSSNAVQIGNQTQIVPTTNTVAQAIDLNSTNVETNAIKTNNISLPIDLKNSISFTSSSIRNEKILLTTNNLTSLSLNNMKVAGQHMLAIIREPDHIPNNDRNEIYKKDQSIQVPGLVIGQNYSQQPRLIIIEEKDQKKIANEIYHQCQKKFDECLVNRETESKTIMSDNEKTSSSPLAREPNKINTKESIKFISSTSCMPENGNVTTTHPFNNGYRNSQPSTNSCSISNGHGASTYVHGNEAVMRHAENSAKMTNTAATVADADLFSDNNFGLSTYFNLDNASQHHHHHHPPSHHHYEDINKKQTIQFHQIPSNPPVYSNINCSLNVENGQTPRLYLKSDYENVSIYPMTQCAQTSTSSSVLSIPDSPSNIHGYHQSNNGSTTNSTPTSQQRQPSSHQSRSLCVAKKSSSNYELKREMAESSGLSPCGTPYLKSRSGRKGGNINISNSTNGNNNPMTIVGTVGSNNSGSSNANNNVSNNAIGGGGCTTVDSANQQFTDADSNSGNAQSSKTFVPCKVCGDKASGYHYGVTSCEGCKGFFRRSIQKQIEYRCLRDGKCLIIRLNRNRCQYCRFKKCLAVGMSRDSVRYGRVPKKSKEKERLDEKSGVTQAEADQSTNDDSESKGLVNYETALTISQAHYEYCSYTDDKIKGINKKPIFLLSSQTKRDDNCSSPDIGSVSESLEAQKIELWEHLALLITPCIQRVVEFAKRIPQFTDLTQDDQLILIKLGFFEVWLVHISKTVDFVESTLTFADGSFLSRRQLELMFNHEFVGNLFHLMSGLCNLNLSDTEIALFSAIILLQPDRPQIYDIKSITKMQEKIIAALKYQLTKHSAEKSDHDPETFQKLMMKSNELRALNSSHSLHLQWFRTNWTRLKLPPLFAEIFDIPKSASFASSTSLNQPSPSSLQNHPQQTNIVSFQTSIQPSSTTSIVIKAEPFDDNSLENGTN